MRDSSEFLTGLGAGAAPRDFGTPVAAPAGMKNTATLVRDLMTTALITLKPSDSIDSADMEMKFTAIRHIPIVDQRHRLVGMVSNRDILRALAQGGRVVVGEIMTRRLHTVDESAPAHEASELILRYKIGAVPVLNDEQELVGLVTETDFVRYAHEMLGGLKWE